MHESESSTSLNPKQQTLLYQLGTLVRVTQQIPRRTQTTTTVITGKVVGQERQCSGSWFARNPRDKLWLDRLLVKKNDGELSILNLDEYTAVEIIHGPPGTSDPSPLIEPAQDAAANVT